MKIYLTRHGETEWNEKGLMQGWENSKLTEKGIGNAIKLGESLKHIAFDVIYSSPLGRARDTAEYIKGDSNTPIIVKEELKEMGFGVWEGKEHKEVKMLYTEQHEKFWKRPNLYEAVNGGESFEQLFFRLKNVWNDIISSGAENVLIVTHAVVLKVLYAIIKKYELKDLWQPPFMNGTCLTVAEVCDEKVRLILEADMSHLE